MGSLVLGLNSGVWCMGGTKVVRECRAMEVLKRIALAHLCCF